MRFIAGKVNTQEALSKLQNEVHAIIMEECETYLKTEKTLIGHLNSHYQQKVLFKERQQTYEEGKSEE